MLAFFSPPVIRWVDLVDKPWNKTMLLEKYWIRGKCTALVGREKKEFQKRESIILVNVTGHIFSKVYEILSKLALALTKTPRLIVYCSLLTYLNSTDFWQWPYSIQSIPGPVSDYSPGTELHNAPACMQVWSCNQSGNLDILFLSFS